MRTKSATLQAIQVIMHLLVNCFTRMEWPEWDYPVRTVYLFNYYTYQYLTRVIGNLLNSLRVYREFFVTVAPV